MRKTSWALVAATALMGLGVTTAEAGITCKIIPSWCPDDHGSGGDKDGHDGSQGRGKDGHTSVPEPASLLLLGAGVSAVGAAVARRRRRK